MTAADGDRKVHRLVSFLGTGHYYKTIYRLDCEGTSSASTPYVCRALAGFFRPEEIKILATQAAEDRHRTGLEEALREGGFPPPRFERIPQGQNSDERWEQFELLKDQLRGSGGPVMLDVTHGFRSQPLFAASVVAFVRAVDGTPPDLRICYGAFEAKKNGSTPIWEITEFVTLLDWAQSLRMFLRTGRAKEAADETMRLGRVLARGWAESGQGGERPNLDTLGKALEAFGADLETLRTGDLLVGRKGQAKSSADRLLHAARESSHDAEKHVPALADILGRVIEMAEPLAGERSDLSGEEGRRAVAALATLYLDLGRYLEAVATVREGWVDLHAPKTALCPGAESFDKEQRQRAEQRVHHREKRFKEVSDRRNDLLHAQYRAGSSAQKAAKVIKTTEDLVKKFRSASCGADGSCFVNLSNHPSDAWDSAQTHAAQELAERIVDVAFPDIPPEADGSAVDGLAKEALSQFPSKTTHALVQGEFTLAFAFVRRLQAQGITCLAATTAREVEDSGDGCRTSVFRFVRFREYASLLDEEAPDRSTRGEPSRPL